MEASGKISETSLQSKVVNHLQDLIMMYSFGPSK